MFDTKRTSIVLNNVCFSYNKRIKLNVINNVTLSCNSCEIFAIVGPSGCGKTTLLKLISGTKKASHGDITMFGYNNCDDIKKYAQIPGSNLGYMPQNEALPTNFSVYDCVHFFAILCRMNKTDIRSRIYQLLEEVDLFDERHNMIETLSGGMKRRLSLAIAIIHKPQLLVLDEATVGADPFVRRKIWNLLNEIKLNRTTIILTTHYMDECKYADKICFMRDGQVLSVNRLDSLQQLSGTNYLEDAYKSCYQRQYGEKISINDMSSVNYECVKVNQNMGFLYSLNIILILMQRYCRLFVLTSASISAILAMPTSNIYLLNTCYSEVKNVPIGITIDNQQNYTFLSSLTHPSHFVNFIDKHKFIVTNYTSLDKALEDVKKHNIWATIYFNNQFNHAYYQQLTCNWYHINDSLIQNRKVYIYADTANKYILDSIVGYLTDSYNQYWKWSQANLNLNKTFPQIKIMNSLISSKRSSNENGIIYRGLAHALNTFIPSSIMISALALISEMEDKCMERYLSTGLTSYQIFICQLLANTIYITIAAIIAFLNTLYFLDIESKASLYSPFVVILSTVIITVLLGQLIAASFRDRILCMVYSMSFSVFNSICQNYSFTEQSYPYFLKDFLKYLPFYSPLQSVRSTVLYGHQLMHPNVYRGHLSNTIYLLILLPLVFSLFKSRV